MNDIPFTNNDRSLASRRVVTCSIPEDNPRIGFVRNDTTGIYQPAQDWNPGDNVLYGRKCSCLSEIDLFCPIGTNVCHAGFTAGHQMDVQCQQKTNASAVLYLFPLGFFLLLFMLYLCVFSVKGRFACGYARKKLCFWDEERYTVYLNACLDRMQAEERRRRAMILRMQENQGNRVYIPGGTNFLTTSGNTAFPPIAREPTSVMLKTQTYDGDTEETCAICLCNLQVGERVGKIPCGHLFHSECLKSWIPRKNHCPLCHGEALATERQQD